MMTRPLERNFIALDVASNGMMNKPELSAETAMRLTTL